MADAQTLQVQTETRGALPDEAVRLAVQRVSSLLRMAPEPALFARVKLTMAADPAVEHPVIVQANIDLNGRLIRAQAAGQTMREAVGHDCDRIRLGRAAQNWTAIRGGQPAGEPGEWRLAHETPDEPTADAELVDYDFHLFTGKSTGEDSVIYRAGDGYRLSAGARQLITAWEVTDGPSDRAGDR